MSVDAEVVKVRQAIANVHKTFRGLSRDTANLTQHVDHRLENFDAALRAVNSDVENIRSGVTHITDKFPQRGTYLAVLLTVDVLIWLLAAFLLYKIIQSCRRGTKNSDRVLHEYRQMVRAHGGDGKSTMVVDHRGRPIPIRIPRRKRRHYEVDDVELGSPTAPLIANEITREV